VKGVTAEEVNELFSIRRALEPMAVRRATATLRDDAKAIKHLRGLIKKMDVEKDPYAWGLLNEDFHKTIYHAAKMPRVEAIVNSMWAATEPYMRRFSRTQEHIERAQRQHREILDAIVEGDAKRAETLIRQQITYSREVYTQDLFAET
jgi:DNA-binding GntR family transcriptional regulator